MQLFGSLTAFKNLLSSVATSIGSAGTNSASTHSAAVVLQSGDAAGSTSNSGAVTIKTGSATGTRGLLTLDSALITVTCPTITMSSTVGLTAATSLTLTSAAITLAGPITLPATGSLTSATSMTLTAPTITLTASTKVSVGGAIEFTSANTRTSLAAPVSQAAAAATQTFDCATSSMFRMVNHTGLCTVTLSNMAEGQSITVLADTVANAAAVSSGVTATASTDKVNKTAHGLLDGDAIVITAMTDGAGLSINTVYYVINKTADNFELSATRGGTKIDITSDGSAMTYQLQQNIVWTDGVNAVKWSNQVVPLPTTTASRWDRYMFQKIGGVIFGSASTNNY